ncbi:hypothetical protein D3Z60_09230 [Lachnospiraceae bacterium]|jgi:hypothetical protein|nr:hypothetical protein [Lachnospiraceae bacterium]
MKQEKIIGITFAALGAVLVVLCGILYVKADRTAPVIAFESVDTVYREGMDEAEILAGARAYDSVEGDVTGRIVIEKIIEVPENGQAVVFYAVSDSSGNVAKASRVFEAVFDVEKETGGAAEGLMEAGITAELGSLQKDGNIAGPDNGGKEQDDAGQNGSTGEQDDAGQGGSTGGGDNSEQGNSDRREAAGTPAPSPSPGWEPSPSPETRSEPRNLETSRNTSSEPEPELPPQEAPIQETSAPELTLKVSEVRVKAGQGPAWVDIIGTLKDDKDDYATLFGNLSVGRYDRNKPGSYQVGVSTQDSDGNSSQTVPITIIVE